MHSLHYYLYIIKYSLIFSELMFSQSVQDFLSRTESGVYCPFDCEADSVVRASGP